MKIFLKLVFVSFIFLIPNLVKSQNFENFEKHISKEWKLESYEINGTKLPPKPGHESDKMIFTEDHKSESINNGISQIGTWKFDSENGILIVVDDNYKFEMKLKVISYADNKCVLELENPENQIIRLNLVTN